MFIKDILPQYFQKNLRITHNDTRKKYQYSLNNLRDSLQREPRLSDLTDDNIAAMMTSLRDKGLSPRTINDRRSRLRAFWEWAARRGMVKDWPTVQKMREPRRVPIAFTLDEMHRILDACLREKGTVGGIPASLWFSALVLLAWNTGARVTELLLVEFAHIDQERRLLFCPAENRKGQSADKMYRLTDDTLAAINMIAFPERRRVFVWGQNYFYLWTRFGGIVKRAGLPNDNRHKFHAIRKSVASHVRLLGGDASLAMGHADPSVTRHYYDPRVIGEQYPADILPSLTDPRNRHPDRRQG